MKNTPSTMFAALIITSCASAPTDEEIQNANYGNPVASDRCITVAEEFISYRLRDPSSAQFSEVQCGQGWEGNVPLAGLSATFGHRFSGFVNGKNAFGAYVGFQPFSGIVRDDGSGPRVVRYCLVSSTSEYRMCIPQMVQ